MSKDLELPYMTNPLDRLRHHVTGAIERGEGTAIVEQPSRKAFGPFYSVSVAPIGSRIELAPHLDRWMMGDRYGQVVACVRRIDTAKGKRWSRCKPEFAAALRVKLDVSGKTVTIDASGIGNVVTTTS